MAMDFSGRIGRVIDNPVEAQSAAMEEGHAWRVRHKLSFHVISVNNARSRFQKNLYRWLSLLCSDIHTEQISLCKCLFLSSFDLTKVVCLFIKLIGLWGRCQKW